MSKHIFVIVLLTLSLFACSDKAPLKWDTKVAELTGKDLQRWLRNAPFNSEFRYQGSGDDLVITNFDQVFPFMGKFKNFEVSHDNKAVYEEQEIVFKDTQWGDSFVYGLLMHNPKELELDNYYTESGNVVFSGTDALQERYTARLSKAKLYEKNDVYTASVYKVTSNYKRYLFGFYQQGQLVVEFGFPIKNKKKSEVLKKLKEVNEKLNLNVAKWNDATIKDL